MILEDIELTLHERLGAIGIVKLLARMGSAAAVYAATEDELCDDGDGLNRDIARSIARRPHRRQAEAEMRYMERHGLRAVASTDAAYPQLLLDCADYPHVLYVRGEVEALGDENMAMVGTREMTSYGFRMCDTIVGRLSEVVPSLCVVSGLALGVDAECHKAAMKYGLRTVAVVANALPEVTPAIHSRLADEIVAKGGAIITELHSQTKQNGNFFIPRNRIIAGMSRGTVVVESPFAGGSMHTAQMAHGYGRTVMAVPGRAYDKASAGANRLISSQVAVLVGSGDDVAHEMGWDIEAAGCVPVSAKQAVVLDERERRIVAAFAAGERLDIDTIALRSGFSVGEVAAKITGLEIADVLEKVGANRYELR